MAENMVFQKKKDSAKTVPCKSAGNLFLWIDPRDERESCLICKRQKQKNTKDKTRKATKDKHQKTPYQRKNKQILQKTKRRKKTPKIPGGQNPAKFQRAGTLPFSKRQIPLSKRTAERCPFLSAPAFVDKDPKAYYNDSRMRRELLEES
ncbi:hypothetical protein H9X84_10020 [Anaerotignum lactatifermentans]|uniref:Uncharacterized protein n=2 Tax=Anaerotignum lactatifermentans TaxID=160404 RepID=A0ABS2GCW5_9FIRM|nr:hypothetical protein [Anaerotignum lactatifermentans]MBM6878457.1 hypothetical protein [Anaerotignum lactatifermentans]